MSAVGEISYDVDGTPMVCTSVSNIDETWLREDWKPVVRYKQGAPQRFLPPEEDPVMVALEEAMREHREGVEDVVTRHAAAVQERIPKTWAPAAWAAGGAIFALGITELARALL